jgi:dihydroorotase
MSRCGWTPYDGVKVKGWPVGTILRGNRVMWDGQLLAGAQGRPLRFDGVVRPEHQLLEQT